MEIPASSNASLEAATANWEKRSILLAVFGSMHAFGSKSFTSAASFALYSVVSNAVIGAIPTFFSFKPFQKDSTSFPIGVTAPKPVTTTLLFMFMSSLHCHSAIYTQHLSGDVSGLVGC